MSKIMSLSCLAFLFVLACANKQHIQGERLYTFHCSPCHMDDGSGLEEIVPSIENTSYLTDNLMDFPCLIRKGKPTTNLDTTILQMEPNYALTEYEINNLINFMLSKNNLETMTIAQTNEALEDCPIPLMKYK